MTNPFDRTDTPHLVLVNADGHLCLWPAATTVPDGWTPVHGPGHRDDCLRHINEYGTGPT
ncbi:MbtH family protein [Streptomyces katrae]|uniref:MbtH family protein n=1 Tax=Streptomyces katrae TaxID=68223 RepID=A0ABT7GR66_9ACTN|nr:MULTISPECIES: MbtH family protein [Streptomyces]MDK9496106.1 MbtH family protein [Streptomyces katrae]RST08708.1 MbtH family protein [Streptomyces sp. WAC07149]